MLAFISTEIHKSFKPFFKPDASQAEKTAAGELLGKRFGYLAQRMTGDFLFGAQFTVADPYLFVMCLWAQGEERADAARSPCPAFVARMTARPAVRMAARTSRAWPNLRLPNGLVQPAFSLKIIGLSYELFGVAAV